MLSFFPPPYPDETMYSIIGRYHMLCGNPSSVYTMKELFNSKSTPPLYFPSGLDYLTKEIKNESLYSTEYFINNHTILKFFKPFLEIDTWQKIVNNIGGNEAVRVQFSLGFNTGSDLLRLKGLKICPECIEDDIVCYGNAYFHVNHQVPGNYVCFKHQEWLQMLDAPHVISQRRFVYPTDEVFKEIKLFDSSVKEYFISYAKDIAILLQSNLDEVSIKDIHNKYAIMLSRKGLVGNTGKINNEKLSSLLSKYYPNDFLNCIGCDFTSKMLYESFFNENRTSHPVTHLLFVKFLFGSFEKLLEFEDVPFYPFGQGPFPCLNPVCENYKKDIIVDCEIDKRAGLFLGHFMCECGFKYTRFGPDENGDKKYTISRIVKHGDLWDRTLKKYVLMDKYSRKTIAEMMGSKLENIHGYIQKIKENPDNNFHNTQSHKLDNCTKSNKIAEKMVMYKNKILDLINAEPSITRSEVQKRLHIQYMWLYYHNKDMLTNVLSLLPTKVPKYKCSFSKVDWVERDEEFLVKVNSAIESIKSKEKPIRLTLSTIERNLGLKLGWMLDKLPNTKELIDYNLEDMVDYKIRKIDYIEKELRKTNTPIKRDIIFRKAGLPYRPGKLNDYVEDILRKYLM